jgi:hypothetical protein
VSGSSRACTHKRAGNVGFRGNSGRGLGIAECPLMTQSGHRRHVRTAAIPVAEVTDQENQGPREVALENAASALQNARGLKGRSKD